MKATLRRLFAHFGYRISRIEPPAFAVDAFSDLSAPERAILAAAQPLTLGGPERLASLVQSVQQIVRHGIPGDIVECGVWRGGSMAAIARALVLVGDTSRTLYLYDTFEGMPPPETVDRDLHGRTAAELLQQAPRAPGDNIWAYATLEDVQNNMRATGYPEERIVYVAGKVEDTLPATIPARIALLRLDTDWYASTRHELQHLYPRLSSGGVLIVDDYGHWQGSRQATDEFLATLPRPLHLHRIDYTARAAVKP